MSRQKRKRRNRLRRRARRQIWQAFTSAGELILETDSKPEAIKSVALRSATRLRWRLKKGGGWTWHAFTEEDNQSEACQRR